MFVFLRRLQSGVMRGFDYGLGMMDGICGLFEQLDYGNGRCFDLT